MRCSAYVYGGVGAGLIAALASVKLLKKRMPKGRWLVAVASLLVLVLASEMLRRRAIAKENALIADILGQVVAMGGSDTLAAVSWDDPQTVDWMLSLAAKYPNDPQSAAAEVISSVQSNAAASAGGMAGSIAQQMLPPA